MSIKELYAFYKQHPVVTTDSRDCPEGSIFIALKGESFDGNKFAQQALEKGCALAVVDDEAVYRAFAASPLEGKRMVLVPNSLQAFKDLAREHRRQFAIPVVGITGTNGKTTTKELVRAVLSKKFRVMATEGNYNNDVGVPKTLLRLAPEHEIAVVEMGASHPGDIKTLAETAEPTSGLITNVGKAHLQGFGSLEGVVRTKGELYDNLATRDDSVIFVNAGNPLLMDILPAGVHAVQYCQGAECQGQRVVGEVVACDPFLRLRWRAGGEEWHQVATQLIGSYNIDNVLAAVTVGLYYGVDPEKINHAIENYVPANNRSTTLWWTPTTPTPPRWRRRSTTSRSCRCRPRWRSWATCASWARAATRSTWRWWSACSSATSTRCGSWAASSTRWTASTASLPTSPP